MKFVLILSLAMIAPASAQFGELPRTVIVTDKATGQKISTATIWGNHIVIRDAKGELVGTAIIEPDGRRTFYDPHGKVIQEPEGMVPQ